MKRLTCIILISVFCLGAVALADDEEEKAAIEKALTDFYYGGQRQGDADLLRQIFHPDWMLFSVNNGELVKFDLDTYCGFANPQRAAQLTWDWEIYYVDVTGHAASAKVRLENDNVTFIDYFNMLKLDGKWWIVHKISYGTPK